jgi:branched-subunit amino acid aminotransferase/4-amino-4-deoxychorismate lyase
MSVNSIYRWHEGALSPLEYCDMTDTVIEVADSWLVTEGLCLALSLHQDRFSGSIDPGLRATLDVDAFWDAALSLIPRAGDWFPRGELQSRSGAPLLIFRLRSAPALSSSVIVATQLGSDPRTTPRVKGPDLDAMLRLRTGVQPLGAGEAIILTSDGYVVEGAYSGLLWWRGEILCGPPREFDRIESVTVRTVLTLALALGIETHEEAVTPAELDGVELWSLSALHGIRIVTGWVDGPGLAELPGRLAQWRSRLGALRRPLP